MKKLFLLSALAMMSFAATAQPKEAAAEVNQYGQTVKATPVDATVQDGILVFQNKAQNYKMWFDIRVQGDAAVFFGAPEYADKIGNGMSIRRSRFAVKAQLDKNWYGELDTDWTSGTPEIKDAYLGFTGVDNLVIDNVLADTNRDAFDIDCCANVKITNCVVNSLNDDAIVLKSSYGLGWPKATENVLIKNCHVSGYDPGTVYYGTYETNITAAPDRDGPTGRIKFGTESNGGFKNITIKNCTFKRCRGLALETVDGALIENIDIQGRKMDDIWNSPIYIRVGDRMRGPKELPASKAHKPWFPCCRH